MSKKDIDQRPTIAEIAVKAGVSIPTVSRVLNHRPDVSQATRERVERAIHESGFVRSRAANALRRGRNGLIELLVPGFENPYVFEVIHGVEETAEVTDFRLVLSSTINGTQRERQWLNKVTDGSIDGVIIMLPEGQAAYLQKLQQRHIPFVVIDHRGELGPETPSVGSTNWAGARLATAHLLSLGHRRIGLINGPLIYHTAQERLGGYRAALETIGVPFDPALVRQGTFLPESGFAHTAALLALPDPPTAIFAGNDLQAIGVYRCLNERGIAIPTQMSVVGFDDVLFSPLLSPPLTTVHQPLIEMGRVATTMLLRLINGEKLESVRMELSTSLVVRQSSAPR